MAITTGCATPEEKRLKTALIRWLKIRQEETGHSASDATSLDIDMDKSCLLRRLCDGKEPFDEPPPTVMSAPWYELLEEGRGEFTGALENLHPMHHCYREGFKLALIGVFGGPFFVLNQTKDGLIGHYIANSIKRPFSDSRWKATKLGIDTVMLGDRWEVVRL